MSSPAPSVRLVDVYFVSEVPRAKAFLEDTEDPHDANWFLELGPALTEAGRIGAKLGCNMYVHLVYFREEESTETYTSLGDTWAVLRGGRA